MSAAQQPQQPQLKRAITRNTLLLLVIGDVLGAGIYALVGEVAGRVGGGVWAAFLLALTLAVFTAFAYAELVTKYPQAAGAAVYVNKAWRRPFLTFMVAFTVMSSGLTSAATLARGFGGDYLSVFVDIPTAPVALAFVIVMGLINLRGIAESVKLNVVLTIVELVGLLLVVVVGFAAIAERAPGVDPGRLFEFKEGTPIALAIISGAGLAFYALIGFEDSVNMAEEVVEPARAYPRALFGGLIVAGTLYVLVTSVASIVVPTERLAGSDGPLLEVVLVGPWQLPPELFSAIALFALTNGALINMIMASRVVYGMANERIIPPKLGVVSRRLRTPWLAIAVTTAIVMVLVVSGDLEDLADTTVLLLLVVFTAVNIATLVLRRDHVAHHHFRAPTVLPVVGAIVSLALMTTKEWTTFVRAAILLAVGVVLWLINRRFLQRQESAMDTGQITAIQRRPLE